MLIRPFFLNFALVFNQIFLKMNEEKKNYYEILGITEEEKNLTGKSFNDCVSKKYKKLALQWHPDRWVNGTDEEKKTAEEKFKEISEAYSILSDETKRKQYDNGGRSFEDMDMSVFFRDFNPFGGFRRQRKGNDIQYMVTVTLQEAYSGCKKTISVPYDKPCPHCNGTGSEDGKTHKCPHCNGTGQIVYRKNMNGMMFQSATICPHCHGTGSVIKKKCKECDGTGFVKEYKDIEITVPKGIRTNMAMAMEGMGEHIDNGLPGDLVIVFNVTEDNYFSTNDGVNLIHTESVDFNKALLGCDVECKTVDGSIIKVKVPECTKDGEAFTYQGKGMPVLNHPGRYGSYTVVVKYIYPNKLTDEQKNKLKNF